MNWPANAAGEPPATTPPTDPELRPSVVSDERTATPTTDRTAERAPTRGSRVAEDAPVNEVTWPNAERKEVRPLAMPERSIPSPAGDAVIALVGGGRPVVVENGPGRKPGTVMPSVSPSSSTLAMSASASSSTEALADASTGAARSRTTLQVIS